MGLTDVAFVSSPENSDTTGELTDQYACSGHLKFLRGSRGVGFVARDSRSKKLRWTSTLQIIFLTKMVFCNFVLQHCVMSQSAFSQTLRSARTQSEMPTFPMSMTLNQL